MSHISLEQIQGHPNPSVYPNAESLPRLFRSGIIFLDDFVAGRTNSLEHYFFDQKEWPGVTANLLNTIRERQPGGTAFFNETIEPLLRTLGSRPITDDLCQRVVNLTNDWCFHDPVPAAGGKIGELFEAFAAYPLGHASFGDTKRERWNHAPRSMGLNANILFSQLFTPDSFSTELTGMSLTDPPFTREFSNRIANITHAFSQTLERNYDHAGIFEPDKGQKIIQSVNRARYVTQPPDIQQAYRTGLSKIAFFIAGDHALNLQSISTPVCLDALHSRNDLVRDNAIRELRISDSRIGLISKDRHLLRHAISITQLNQEDYLFWQSIESLFEASRDTEVLGKLAERISGGNDFDHNAASTGYLCGTMNNILDILEMDRPLKDNALFRRIINPKFAVDIILNILRIYQEQTSPVEIDDRPARARIRHLATRLNLIDDEYKHEARTEWTILVTLIPDILANVSKAEQDWVFTDYSKARRDLERLREFVKK